MFPFFKLDQTSRKKFYQAKYLYFKHFLLGTLITSSLVYFLLLFSDLEINGSFSPLFVILRSLIIIPLMVVILFYRKTENYRIMTTVSFLTFHAIIWGNIWIISYLPDQSFINESFLIMAFFLLLISFAMPPIMAIIGQVGFIFDILLANDQFHYSDIAIILSYNVLAVILLILVDLLGTQFYYDHYLTSGKLEFALIHDPLTNVFNRRKLNELMGSSYNLTHLSSEIGFLLMDIDHFKTVNDNYGHDNGDRILQFTAMTIQNSLRENDLVIRWGGEEFAAILVDCSPEEIARTAERIRRTIESTDNQICPITISIGTKVYRGDNCIADIKLADQALYAAKESGRNRVIAYEDLQENDAGSAD